MATQATPAGPREVFSDVRGASRMLRTSWHPEDGVVVLSVWEDHGCLATFRLPAAQVPDLVGVLTRGLAGLATAAPMPRTGAFTAPEPDPGPDTTFGQVAGRARTELTRGARLALDGIGRGALTLRDRLGR